MCERQQPARAQAGQEAVTGRPVAVQVDGDVGGRPGPVEGARDGPPGCGGGQHPVHGTGRGGHGGQLGGAGQHQLVPGERPPQRPQRGHPGQQVPEPEGTQDEYAGPVPALAPHRFRPAPRRPGGAWAPRSGDRRMHGIPGHRPTGRPGGREAALPGPRSEPCGRRRDACVGRPATRGHGRTAHRPDRGHRTAAGGSCPIPARPPDTDHPDALHPDRAERGRTGRPGRHGLRSSTDRSRR